MRWGPSLLEQSSDAVQRFHHRSEPNPVEGLNRERCCQQAAVLHGANKGQTSERIAADEGAVLLNKHGVECLPSLRLILLEAQ